MQMAFQPCEKRVSKLIAAGGSRMKPVSGHADLFRCPRIDGILLHREIIFAVQIVIHRDDPDFRILAAAGFAHDNTAYVSA